MRVALLACSLLFLAGCSVGTHTIRHDGQVYGIALKACVDSFDVVEAVKDKDVCIRANAVVTIEDKEAK